MKTIRKTEKRIYEIFEVFRNFGLEYLTAIFYLFRLVLLKQILDTKNTQKDLVFTLPPHSSWGEFRYLRESLLKELIHEVVLIERENTILDGIFSSFDFQAGLEKDRANNLLSQLILILADFDFSDFEVVKRIDLALCQELSKQSKTGNFVVPESISKLAIKLLAPQEAMSIYDPFCGVGSFLIECASQISESSSKDISFYGQERNQELVTITRIRLLLHGVSDFDIKYGDTIQEPKFLEDGKLKSFDLIMSVFPWGKQDFQKDILTLDPYHRFRYGIPSTSATEFIYIQHILATLNSNGKAAVIVPNGVLFRGGSEGKIRKNIIKADLLEAVIALPANLFDYTGISITVLIFVRDKSQERKDTVLFIDASNSYAKNRSHYYLSEQNIKNIVETYTDFSEKEGYAKTVSFNELAKNDYLLNVNRYVFLPKQTIDLHSELTKLHKLEAEQNKAEKDFHRNFKNYLETVEESKYLDELFKIQNRSPIQYPYGIFFSCHPACGGDAGFCFLWFESFAEMRDYFIDFELSRNLLLELETSEKKIMLSNTREGFNIICDNPQNWKLGIQKLNQVLSEWIEVKWCGTFEQLLNKKGKFEIEVRQYFIPNAEDIAEKRMAKDREIKEHEVEDFEVFLIDYGI